MRIVALAGGVGGAKLAHGLAQILAPQDLTIVVNTADDFEHFGLHISPDLDTVCYTLAGIANHESGWGRADETWTTISFVEDLGGPAWFRLGDRDLATHLERTRRLRLGEPLSQVARDFCRAWHIEHAVLPMTDGKVATIVQTDEGDLQFQEYFVLRQFKPRVTGFKFHGADSATPAPGISEALVLADGVIICPSNPWVSIQPILSIQGIRSALGSNRVIAVSPIVGGRSIKGPADKMYDEMGIEPSALAVAKGYDKIVSGFVLDKIDANLEDAIRVLGMRTLLADTMMRTDHDRRRLASEVLGFMEVL